MPGWGWVIFSGTIGIESENYFWSKKGNDQKSDFPELVDKKNFKNPGNHYFDSHLLI